MKQESKKYKKYKTRPTMYSAWNYEQEIIDLDEASKKGWQLVCGMSFAHKYEYDPDVQYRYQMDYQPHLKGDTQRYVETYREQGWELINSTFNGWYYFRKKYDETLPEEQYVIYTDESSLKEMRSRWSGIALALIIFSAIYMCVLGVYFAMEPKLPTLIMACVFVVYFGVFLHGYRVMKNPQRKAASKWDRIRFVLFFVVLIGGMTVSLSLMEARPHLNNCHFAAQEYSAIGETPGVQINYFDVEYPDNYFLDLKISAAAPVRYSILDVNGNEVFYVEGAGFDEENVKLRLSRGEYKIVLTQFAGGRLDVTYELR